VKPGEGRWAAALLYAVPVLAALAQLSWMPALSETAYPNLCVIAVAARCWARGTRATLGWAIAAGVILDLGAYGPIGPHALALLAAAYAAGLVVTTVDGGPLVLPISAGVATVAYGLALLLISAVLRDAPSLHQNASWIAWTAAWDTLLAPVAVFVVSRADRAFTVLRW
jgi:rod shape-determining protein MreD